jgi:hypothetical protein
MIKLTQQREITPYPRAHPDDRFVTSPGGQSIKLTNWTTMTLRNLLNGIFGLFF